MLRQQKLVLNFLVVTAEILLKFLIWQQKLIREYFLFVELRRFLRFETQMWSTIFDDSTVSRKGSSNGGLSPREKAGIKLTDAVEQLRSRGAQRANNMRGQDAKILEMFKALDGSGRINMGKYLEALASSGLRQTDPRLSEMKRSVATIQSNSAREMHSWTTEGLCIDEDLFAGMVMDNMDLIKRALTGELVIPHFEEFCHHIDDIFEECSDEEAGKPASYIPQLARVDPALWGASICTIDGQRYSIGDVNIPFTIQSTSKPFGYAIACDTRGAGFVHSFIGQEPSGRSFNELCLDNNNKPHNPMINSGAIITSTLIKPELKLADRFDYAFRKYRQLTGGEYLGFNNAVFLSEREAADRNFALAYFMRENKCFDGDVDLSETLDFYFQMCSLEATCESASVMAATLANGGVCPITGETVLDPRAVRNTLCLMHSCGMYDYSGQFAFHCGVPAKSGVSGVILLVVPNVLGLALYSPRLDSCGNSVRGVKFCKSLIDRFSFHHFDYLSNPCGLNMKIDPRKTDVEQRADVMHHVLYAAAAGDISALRRYRMLEMDMGAGDYDGRTALHLSAAEGHVNVVEFLLNSCEVPVDPKDRWGDNPLHDAVRGDHREIVDLLLQFHRRQSAPLPSNLPVDSDELKLNNLNTQNGSLSNGKASGSNGSLQIIAENRRMSLCDTSEK